MRFLGTIRMGTIGLAGVLGLATMARNAPAQVSFPFLHSLSPCGARRGTTVEVLLRGGHNYWGAYKVLIEGAGISGEVVPPSGGWPAPDAKTGTPPLTNEIKLKLVLAPDAPLGVRELRVATPQGVSTVGLFVVSDDPEIMESEPNNTTEKAESLSIPCVANGRIQQGEDVDTYKIRVAAGQQVAFAVLSARLQDKVHDLQQHIDPLVSVLDSTGREIASGDDYYRADPLLLHRFEKAGDYFVQIRDVGYAGNPHWVYRLTVTSAPFVTSTLPMAVIPGSEGALKPWGANLPATVPMPVSLEGNTETGAALVRLKTSAGYTNPIPVLATTLPVSAAEGAWDAPKPLSVPAAVSAHLSKSGEEHRYRFKASKGRGYVFEVGARRFETRTDPILAVRNSSGVELASNDDAMGQDAQIEWTAPSDGEFDLAVRDLHRRGGENFTYVLTARESGQDFTLRCDDDKMKLAPGGSAAWYVRAERKFGFAGPITVEVKGLPAGVTAAPLTIPSNMAEGALILTASPDAKLSAEPVQVVGTAEVPGLDGKPALISRTAKPVCEIYIPGGGRGLYDVNTHFVAVVPEADLKVSLSTTSVTLQPGGTVRIDVTIERHKNYKKPVTLDVFLRHLGSVYGNPLPPGVTLDEGASKTLLGPEETKGHIVLKATADAPSCESVPIAVLGQASINFVIKVSYSGPPVLLTVKKQ